MRTPVALLLELGIILAALSVLGAAARRFTLSPVPLYLLAGLAIGEGGIAPVPAAGVPGRRRPHRGRQDRSAQKQACLVTGSPDAVSQLRRLATDRLPAVDHIAYVRWSVPMSARPGSPTDAPVPADQDRRTDRGNCSHIRSLTIS